MAQPLQIVQLNNRKEEIKAELWSLHLKGKLTEEEENRQIELFREMNKIREEEQNRDSKRRRRQQNQNKKNP